MPPGEKTYVPEWAKATSLLKDGKEINYQGVSGGVDFNATGGVTSKIQIWQVKGCQIMPVLTVSG